jgi:hypothetical protein
LSLRYGALEVTVVERMVLDFDRETLIGGIQGWAAGHGPGFEDPVELKSQIIVESSRRMLLDHETQAL